MSWATSWCSRALGTDRAFPDVDADDARAARSARRIRAHDTDVADIATRRVWLGENGAVMRHAD